jgi:hypothetical protein
MTTDQREGIEAYLYRAVTTNAASVRMVEDGLIQEPTAGPILDTAGGALDFFGADERRAARRMGRVYELLYCFENSVRELIETTLKDTLGPERWWLDGVPTPMRQKADARRRDDDRARWHGPRGSSPLSFVDFPELAEILLDQWETFEDLLGDKAWVESYFAEMNRSRRAIGHTGELSEHAVERMELLVREWLRVVG